MYTEIIKKLRNIQSRSKSRLLNGVADALEALSEQLRHMHIERDMLARKLKEVEAERDAEQNSGGDLHA